MSTPSSWFAKTVSWLDNHGKGAWLTAMILGFIFLWPLGLAILFYMIWSNRMSRSFFGCRQTQMPRYSTGNSAFDAYKQETLKRLENEQTAFQDFLQRLRKAKDQSEFNDYMNTRTAAQEPPKAQA